MLELFLIIFFIILGILFCNFNSNTSNCGECKGIYQKCMMESDSLKQMETCSKKIFCKGQCKDCGDSIMDCNVEPQKQCSEKVEIPVDCAINSANSHYFQKDMCLEDLKEVCNDPDVYKQICSNEDSLCCDQCNKLNNLLYYQDMPKQYRRGKSTWFQPEIKWVKNDSPQHFVASAPYAGF